MMRTKSTADTVAVQVTWSPSAVHGLLYKRDPGEYSDPGGSGFKLRINKDGSGTWWYRFRNGDTWPSKVIGPASIEGGDGTLTFHQAKAKYEGLRGEASRKRKALDHGMTLAKGFDLYIKGRISKRTELNLAERTVEGMRKHFNKDLAPAHGWHLEMVTSLEWENLLLPIKERTPHGARRCFYLLQGIYSFLLSYKEIECDNPMLVPDFRLKFVNKGLKTPRDGHLQALDFRAFFQAVKALKFKTSQEAIKLLQLLGWRRSAVLRMKWDQIDFEEGFYTVKPGDIGWKGYTGPIAMSDEALAVLTERRMRLLDERPRSGALGDAQKKRQEQTDWVFPAYRGRPGPMVDIRGSFNTASKSLPYRVQGHDLRRGFATIGGIVLSGDRHMVGRLISHQSLAGQDQKSGSQQTEDYIARYLAAERIAANKIASAIVALGEGKADDLLKAKLRDRGMDVDRLQLADMVDDDTDAQEAERKVA